MLYFELSGIGPSRPCLPAKRGTVKLPKHQKVVLGLCLVAITFFAICAALLYLDLPGVEVTFVVGAVPSLVALGISEREWPFHNVFQEKPVLMAIFEAPVVMVCNLPAWWRNKDKRAAVKSGNALVIATPMPALQAEQSVSVEQVVVVQHHQPRAR